MAERYLIGNVKGPAGEDGFSPVATVEQTATGAKITITDKSGTTEAVVQNGDAPQLVAGDGIDITNNVISNTRTVPTNVSAFTNDANYVTSSAMDTALADKQDTLTAGTNITIENNVISASGGGASYTAGAGIDITNDEISVDSTVALKTDIPTNVSAFTNDAGYITGYTETDPVFTQSPAYGITQSDIDTWDGKSDFSGDYDDLTNKPTIPTAVSELTNDSGFITAAQVPQELPSIASGDAGKVLSVNSGETGVVWTTPAGGSSGSSIIEVGN